MRLLSWLSPTTIARFSQEGATMCLTRDCGLLSPFGGIDSCCLHALVGLRISKLLNARHENPTAKTGYTTNCCDGSVLRLVSAAHHPPGKNNLRSRPQPATKLMASSHTRKGYSIVHSTARFSRNTSQRQQQSAGNGCSSVVSTFLALTFHARTSFICYCSGVCGPHSKPAFVTCPVCLRMKPDLHEQST